MQYKPTSDHLSRFCCQLLALSILAYATVALFAAGHPLSEMQVQTRYLVLASILLAPFMALVMFEIFNKATDVGLAGVFSGKGGRAFPPHSEASDSS